MMDSLDRLAGPATDLLHRVDDLLARNGAPDDHRIWLLLRRVGALPGEAVDGLTALRVAPLSAAGATVRALARDCDDACAATSARVDWAGAGADAFAAQRAALTARLNGDPDSLVERLNATAAYLAAIADWTAWCRAALARTLAEVLVSVEAVAVIARGGSGAAGSMPQTSRATSGALAAAEIGARVLVTVAEAYDRGEILVRRWAPNLAEVTIRPSGDVGARLDGTTRIRF